MLSVTYKSCCDICCDVSDGWGTRQNAVDCAKLDGWVFRDRNKLAVCPSCQRMSLADIKDTEFGEEFEPYYSIWERA